jgi:hypothetical protein
MNLHKKSLCRLRDAGNQRIENAGAALVNNAKFWSLSLGKQASNILIVSIDRA